MTELQRGAFNRCGGRLADGHDAGSGVKELLVAHFNQFSRNALPQRDVPALPILLRDRRKFLVRLGGHVDHLRPRVDVLGGRRPAFLGALAVLGLFFDEAAFGGYHFCLDVLDAFIEQQIWG